jgi:UDP-glucose 4-epimerase
LVTGGTDYIGSHTVLQLLETEYQVIVLDNLCNASSDSLKRVEALTGKKIKFVEGDIRDNTI